MTDPYSVEPYPLRPVLFAAQTSAGAASFAVQALAASTQTTIDRLMLELAATMCASACRQLATTADAGEPETTGSPRPLANVIN